MKSVQEEGLGILVVSHYVLPHLGGIEVIVDQLGAALQARGHRVSLMASGPRTESEVREDGVRVSTVRAWNGFEEALHVPYPIFSPALIPTLFREMRAAEVVHVHGLLYLGSMAALGLAAVMGKPVVVTEHVGFVRFPSAILNALQRSALFVARALFRRRADAVISYNPAVQHWLREGGPWAAEVSVAQGVDTTRFRPPTSQERRAARTDLGLPEEGRPVVLFTGRLVHKKRPELLIAAADPAFDIVLCGPGTPPGNLPTGTVVLGGINHDRMISAFHAADIYCLPSHGEGFPVSLCEAMACGLPSVVAADPLYASRVTDDEVMQVEATPGALRTALCHLATDPSARERRGRAARLRALASFGREAVAGQHEAVFRSALATRRGRNERQRERTRSNLAIALSFTGCLIVLLGMNLDRDRPFVERDGFRAGTSEWTVNLSHENDSTTYYASAPERDEVRFGNGVTTKAGPSRRIDSNPWTREIPWTARTMLWMAGWPWVRFESADKQKRAIYEWRENPAGVSLRKRIQGVPRPVYSWRHQMSFDPRDLVMDASGRVYSGETWPGLTRALSEGSTSGNWVAVYNPRADAAWRLELEEADQVTVKPGVLWIERKLKEPTGAPSAELRFETVNHVSRRLRERAP